MRLHRARRVSDSDACKISPPLLSLPPRCNFFHAISPHSHDCPVLSIAVHISRQNEWTHRPTRVKISNLAILNFTIVARRTTIRFWHDHGGTWLTDVCTPPHCLESTDDLTQPTPFCRTNRDRSTMCRHATNDAIALFHAPLLNLNSSYCVFSQNVNFSYKQIILN